MAKIYANENFFYDAVAILIDLGHDVLTTRDAGKANLGIPDEEVLAFAKAQGRIMLTFNYRHFIRLHRIFPDHAGIIVCTEDRDIAAPSLRIHEAIENLGGELAGQLIRINRPNSSQKNSE